MKIIAHVPVQQFGFVEIEGTLEEAKEIERLYNYYAEKPVSFGKGTFKRLEAFVGGKIDYDEVNHIYSWKGVIYLSASQYAESLKKPFDAPAIASKMAEKTQDNPEDIIKMWKLKGDASRDFGNAMHKALQLYEQYHGLSSRLQKTYHLHDNFVLKDIVESFYKGREKEVAHSEITVVNHKAQQAGCIDRLVILGDKHGRVEDFKSGEIVKNLPIYREQLNFYTEIMKAAGWKMDKPKIHGWNGKWETYGN